jgi:hypothetical protein
MTETTPRRIQRKRTRGWRMPANTVYVGRPGKWGNPFYPQHSYVVDRASALGIEPTVHVVLSCYREGLHRPSMLRISADDVRRDLRGKNLACWCPLDKPCHADILLEVANG